MEIGDCAVLAVRARVGSCADGDVFVVDLPADLQRCSHQPEVGPGPVLVVTLLTVPLLRQVTKLDALRAE